MIELQYPTQKPVITTRKGIKYKMEGYLWTVSNPIHTKHHRVLGRINPEKWGDKTEVNPDLYKTLISLDKKFNKGKHKLDITVEGMQPDQFNQALKDLYVKDQKLGDRYLAISHTVYAGISCLAAPLAGPFAILAGIGAAGNAALATNAAKNLKNPEIYTKWFDESVQKPWSKSVHSRLYQKDYAELYFKDAWKSLNPSNKSEVK